MSQSIKNFSIFKNNKKEKDTHPDYVISAKVQKDNVDEYKEIGSVYIKETTNNQKFFSCSLAKPREFNGKKYAGYVIVDEERYMKMAQVYEDYLISQRDPSYPTPTSQGIDLAEHKKIFDMPVTITAEDLDGDFPF